MGLMWIKFEFFAHHVWGVVDAAPTLEIGHNHIDHATIEKVQAAISSGDTNVKIPDYETLKMYIEKGGYSKLKSLKKVVIGKRFKKQFYPQV